MAQTFPPASLASRTYELPPHSVIDRDECSGNARIEEISRARFLLRILVFPWLIWSAVAWASSVLTASVPGNGRARIAKTTVHLFLYLFLGLPLTIVIFGELLITVNETLIGEQADYRLQSDFEVGMAQMPLRLPGPMTPAPARVPAGPTPVYRRYLAELYAPVIVQKLAHHPEWDIPVALQFDGNENPRDNVVNEPSRRPHAAAIYGELTAETEDSYYFAYGLYHIKDYDHPLRELLTDWTYHDSDNEGLMIRVDKQTMRVAQAETWFHNRFLLYDETGESRGSEPVHGAIHTEGDTRVVVYSQPQGHGVRLFQNLDLDALGENVKILRHRGSGQAVPVDVNRAVQNDATYDLVSFDHWYAQALGPFGEMGEGEQLFEGYIPIGLYPDGREIRIGRFIAGLDYSKNGWSRPKPPWSWDDGWDQIPIWIWHFMPSYAFNSHSGKDLSHEYLYNSPVEKTFGVTAAEIIPLTEHHLSLEFREGDKWASLERRGGNLAHRTYWRQLQLWLKAYVNYVFHALG